MNADLLQATRELSKKPWLFKLETPSPLTYAQRLREAEKVHGAIVLLPPWEIELEGPFDIRNISKILGYGTALSRIKHIGKGWLFTGVYPYAHHFIYPEIADFAVHHFDSEVAGFLELGSQQHITIEKLKIEGYPGGKWIQFTNLDAIKVDGLGEGCWTENIRIRQCFGYGHPAVGIGLINESSDGKQNSFINFWCDMHISLDGPDSVGLLCDRAHITAADFRLKFNLHEKATCMEVKNHSLLRNNNYQMLIEGEGTRLKLDSTSTMHGYGAFVRDDWRCGDKIDGEVHGDFLRDGYQPEK